MDIRQLLSATSVKPQNLLKTVLLFSVVLLLIWLFLVSRFEYNPDPVPGESIVQVPADSLKALEDKPGENPVSRQSRQSSGIFMSAFTTFMVLVILLGLVWFFIGNKSMWKTQAGDVQQIRSIRLGQNSQLKIVEINEEVWVVGVTTDSICLMHRYPKSEWKEQAQDFNQPQQNTFYNMFRSKT